MEDPGTVKNIHIFHILNPYLPLGGFSREKKIKKEKKSNNNRKNPTTQPHTHPPFKYC